MPRLPVCRLLCVLVTCLPLVAAQSSTDPLARLQAAHDATNLGDPALKPWHMLSSFDLVDPKGAVIEHGTVEEWWAAPDRWHQRISSPSVSGERFNIGSQTFSSPAMHTSYFVGLLLQELINPIPTPTVDPAPSVTSQTKNFGAFTLECLLVSAHSTSLNQVPAVFGIAPTYCLEQSRPQLRFSMSFGVQEVTRNSPGTFQGKAVDLDIKISEGGRPALHATIDQLSGLVVTDKDFTPPADMPSSTRLVRVASGVVAGLRIGGQQPIYPELAKQQRVSGTVLLHGIIGKDGRITSLEVIWSPDNHLSQAALNAVRTWTYKPYLLGGEPVEVETNLTVNFNFAHHL